MVKIFISYRRQDAPQDAGRVYDRLVQEFGQASVFKDVYSIALGENWKEVLFKAVARCDVCLVVIGRKWLSATDEDGTPRLPAATDFVRTEVEIALERHIPVVPLLVDVAAMPTAQQLPDSIRELVGRQATAVRQDPDFHHDMSGVCARIAEVTRAYQTVGLFRMKRLSETISEPVVRTIWASVWGAVIALIGTLLLIAALVAGPSGISYGVGGLGAAAVLLVLGLYCARQIGGLCELRGKIRQNEELLDDLQAVCVQLTELAEVTRSLVLENVRPIADVFVKNRDVIELVKDQPFFRMLPFHGRIAALFNADLYVRLPALCQSVADAESRSKRVIDQIRHAIIESDPEPLKQYAESLSEIIEKTRQLVPRH